MAGSDSGRRPWGLEALRRSLRREDEASASMVSFIVGTSAFLVSSAVLIHFVAEPPGGTSGLEHADLKAKAANALNILLGTHGYPLDWASSIESVDAVERVGLLEMGSSIRVDASKFDAVANGSVYNPSSTNGAVDYDELQATLGLEGYDFHVRAYPLFEPFDSGSYGVEGMEGFSVAYIGDWSGLAEQPSSQAERTTLDALPLAFNDSVRAAVLGTGDVYKDDQDELRDYLIPLLGGSPSQTVINAGSGTPKYGFRSIDASVYEGLVPLALTPSRALALVDEDAGSPVESDLGYTKSREIRVVLGLANMSGMSVSGKLDWSEWVDTANDTGDYGWVEVSPDDGATWYQLTNTALARSTGWGGSAMLGKSTTITGANCAACLGENEVWIAFHWVADGDATRGKGWIIDDVTLTGGGATTFTKTFESPEYDLLVIGSNVDQNALTAAEVKNAIRDYVEEHGGRLLVLGGQTNTNWLQPLFHVGVRDATPGVSTPDETHPLLTVPNQLDWEGFDYNDMAWDFTGGNAEDLFSMVVGDGEDEHILSVSAKGAFGASDSDGVVMLTTYLPYEMEAEMAKMFFANVFTYGRYHRLYMEAGPEVPDGIPVATATRTATMDKFRVDGSTDYIEMAFIIYLWAGGASSASDSSSLAPSAPQSFAATAADGSVLLSWQPPASTGTADSLISYKIYRGTMSYLEVYLATVDDANSTFVDQTVTNGRTYYYNITAVSSEGEGDSSGHVSATPATAPGVPLALSASSALLAVALDWDPPASSGGAAVTGYYVYRSMDGSTGWTEVHNTSSSAWTDSDVNVSDTYYYKVHAVNAIGHGANTTAVSAAAGGAPNAPTLLLASGGIDQISLSWTAPVPSTDVTHYSIYRGSTGGELTFLAETGGTNTSFVDAQSGTNATWRYAVRANNSYGAGSASNEVTAKSDGIPHPPTALAATALALKKISLAWAAPADDGGAAITGYEVWRKVGAGGAYALLVAVDELTLTHLDEGLTAGTQYTYKVRAINAVGEGNFGNERSVTALL